MATNAVLTLHSQLLFSPSVRHQKYVIKYGELGFDTLLRRKLVRDLFNSHYITHTFSY